MQRLVLALAMFVALTLAVPAHATLNACAAAKKLCVAKKTAAILKCHAKNEKPPAGLTPAKFAACVQKAKDKFDGGPNPAKGCFAKLEAKFPGGCLTTLDVAALEATVDAYVDDVICQLDSGAGTCPTPTATPTPIATPTATATPVLPPVCNDLIQNGSETGVDCGGVCPPCPLGQGCLVANDCVANSICSAGTCVCGPGQSNCNANPSDGCEVNTTNDVGNCGGCGNFCSAANGGASCVASQCQVAFCNSGFANCDGMVANGCEVNTQTNPNNCNLCGLVCPPLAPNCVAGSCTP